MDNEPVLRPEEVATVLDGGAAGLPVPGDSRRFSLRKPMAIAPEDEARASRRMEQQLAVVQELLSAELQNDIVVELKGFQQELAAVAVGTLPQPAWILCFVAEGIGGVALALDPTCALAFVELALGGAGSTAAIGRRPTPLEDRVMNKVATQLAEPLARAIDVRSMSGSLQLSALPSSLASPGQTLGVGLLNLRIADTDRSGLLLVTPNLLRDPDERRSSQGKGHPGPLVPRLLKASMTVRPVLRGSTIALSDLAALDTGMVLQLVLPESTELDLVVNERNVFRGRITRDDSGPAFAVSWRRGRRMTQRGETES